MAMRTVGVIDPCFHEDWADSVHDHDCVLVDTCNLLNKSILGRKALRDEEGQTNDGKRTPLCHALRSLRSPALPSTVRYPSLKDTA